MPARLYLDFLLRGWGISYNSQGGFLTVMPYKIQNIFRISALINQEPLKFQGHKMTPFESPNMWVI